MQIQISDDKKIGQRNTKFINTVHASNKSNTWYAVKPQLLLQLRPKSKCVSSSSCGPVVVPYSWEFTFEAALSGERGTSKTGDPFGTGIVKLSGAAGSRYASEIRPVRRLLFSSVLLGCVRRDNDLQVTWRQKNNRAAFVCLFI